MYWRIHFHRLIFSAKSIVADWNARGLSSIIPNDSSAVVDGSLTDGRPPITGAKTTNIITRALDLIADLEANNNAKINTVLQVRVNGQSLF